MFMFKTNCSDLLKRALLPLMAIPILLVSGVAHANEPNEAVKCTTKPKSAWVGESHIRRVFEEQKYAKVFLKVSRGNCYEFYAIGKDNSVTEAYYDPSSAELMQSTHMAADGVTQTYDRTKAAADAAKHDATTHTATKAVKK